MIKNELNIIKTFQLFGTKGMIHCSIDNSLKNKLRLC